MSIGTKIATLTLIAMGCGGTRAEERANLHKVVDDLCERCAAGIGGPCELDADRLATAGQQLIKTSWEDLRHESGGLEKMGLIRREVEAAEALAYDCFRRRVLPEASPERLWLVRIRRFRRINHSVSLPGAKAHIESICSRRARRVP